MSDLSKYQQMIMNNDNVQKALSMFAPDGYSQDGMNITAGRFKLFEPREWQKDPIEDLVNGNSVIVQAPVGSGKGIVLQNAISRSRKVAYIIMPTIALAVDMRDRFETLGANVAVWSSIVSTQKKEEIRININEYHAIMLAPESMETVPISKGGILIVDEAHNISMSVGYRSSFANIGKFRHKVGSKCVGLFSATLNTEILDDIKKQFFGVNFKEYRDKNPDRPNLQYHAPINRGYSMNLIYDLLEKNAKAGRSAIIYSFTRKDIEQMHFSMKRKLDKMGYTSIAFHSKIKGKEKALADFMNNKSCVFATSAFGEGIDKKDVGLIIRFGFPFSVTQLVQEAGRAERGLQRDGHYYMFRFGNEKNMFNMNCFSKKEMNDIYKKLSMEEYSKPETKNYQKDSAMLTFLDVNEIIQSRTDNKIHHTIHVTSKDSSKRKYDHLLKKLKSKVNWHTDELQEIDDDWKKHFKNAKVGGYIKYEAPYSKKTYKRNRDELPDDIDKMLSEHNDKVMQDFHDITDFFESDNKKEYLRKYFEEE